MTSLASDLEAAPTGRVSVARLAKIAGGLTFALLVAGAMYLWVVRSDVLLLDGIFAAFCL